MKLRTTLLILLMISALVAQTARGTVPRASADSYPAHAQQAEAKVGATLLTAEQMRKLFATEVGKCCLVVEVAVYPQPENTVSIYTGDFVLRAGNGDIATRASSPELIAALLQPRPASGSGSGGTDVVITPTSSVGYESGGYDPVTGQRRNGGVYTSAGVGVGVGAGGRAPQAGSSDRDRRVMELELREKSLPEGKAYNPVSGYLYFSLPKREKKSNYKLEYTLNGNKMVLPLP
jgi:hypothetical protein